MTRVGNSTKDQGHYLRKSIGYSLLVLAFPFYALSKLAGHAAIAFEVKVVGLHRWMRPCLYAREGRE